MNTEKNTGDVRKRFFYKPKVSIVIPAYNASKYLAEAIDSALAQTYSNTEIIVVNDGSKDNGATAAVAAKYGEKIRYFEKENGGSSSALNMGIANMTGEWFSWLSHDDLYVPEKIERQMRYLNALSKDHEFLSGQVLFSECDLIDGKGALIRKADVQKSCAMQKKVEGVSGNEYLVAEPTEYTFHGCSCLVHKRVFESIGTFDESLRWLNDRDLWFRIFIAGYRIHFIPEPLVKGRIHTEQVSKSIGYSYHNHEQDMFWNRSLDWLLENYPDNENLFFRFARNAYLKTRNEEGDRAFSYIKSSMFKRKLYKTVYQIRATIWKFGKKLYSRIKT